MQAFVCESAAKRHAAGDVLEKSGLPGTIGIQIRVTKLNKTRELLFGGQTLEFKELALTITVKDIKQKLHDLLDKLPVNKQKLTSERLRADLKDESTIGSLNFVDGETLSLEFKERGGR